MDRALVGFVVGAVAIGCSAGGTSDALVVGRQGTGGSRGGPPGSGGTAFVSTGDASVAKGLSAHVESPPGVTVDFITLGCAGGCADIVAVAKGGYEPYHFRWEDGSTTSDRHVCPASTTSYEVAVTDTGVPFGEFRRAPQIARAPLTANVLDCPSDAGAGGSTSTGGAGGTAGCTSGAPTGLPETLTLDVTGAVRYFASGASLPPGKYRVEYVDGCMMWGPAAGGYGWAIGLGAALGTLQQDCLLVGDTAANVVGVLPGIQGNGAPNYADCVTQSKKLPPLDFDFGGGKLGVLNNDAVPFDDVGGETAGGTSPTWRLSYLSQCP